MLHEINLYTHWSQTNCMTRVIQLHLTVVLRYNLVFSDWSDLVFDSSVDKLSWPDLHQSSISTLWFHQVYTSCSKILCHNVTSSVIRSWKYPSHREAERAPVQYLDLRPFTVTLFYLKGNKLNTNHYRRIVFFKKYAHLNTIN